MSKYEKALRDIEKRNSAFKAELGYFIGEDTMNPIRELVDRATWKGPIKKIPIQAFSANGIVTFMKSVCPICNQRVCEGDDYCSHCGQLINPIRYAKGDK